MSTFFYFLALSVLFFAGMLTAFLVGYHHGCKAMKALGDEIADFQERQNRMRAAFSKMTRHVSRLNRVVSVYREEVERVAERRIQLPKEDFREHPTQSRNRSRSVQTYLDGLEKPSE